MTLHPSRERGAAMQAWRRRLHGGRHRGRGLASVIVPDTPAVAVKMV